MYGVNLNQQHIGPDTRDSGLLLEYEVHGGYFHFYQAVHRKVATAFLPVPEVDTGFRLLEAGTTGTLAALFQYFRQELMTDERLPLWNLNRKAAKSHNGLYELLQILIAEQGVADTLIQQMLSGNATVGDLRRVNKVYAEKQQRVAQYTGEYTNGSRTLEQFLEALMYITLEQI
ncbi:hypothetical protein T02_5000 [Trichinella nativa]|uniref:Uncharacterized protein n=1 Tax=Trichinella nativa TaxID=6335 RepID=A0A0V1KQS9_9BILA|nr:hypothetical protein T02_5000 [Trichinella nativa]